MQRPLAACSTTAVVTTQEKDPGATMDSSLKLSAECAETAKKLCVMRKDIETKTKGTIRPLHKTLVFSCLVLLPASKQEYCGVIVQRRVTIMIEAFKQLHYTETRKSWDFSNLERRRLRGHYDQNLQNEKGTSLKQTFYSQNPAILELGSTH